MNNSAPNINANCQDAYFIEGPKGKLVINADDKIMKKVAMLFEVICLGKSPGKTAARYGFTKQRFYQIYDAYKLSGSDGIVEKKKGPKANTVRTDSVVMQIIRYKFIEPDISAEVILQKLKQNGISIGLRTVERTISEYGLQKKTLQFKSGEKRY